MIYLDNASTTKMNPEFVDALLNYNISYYGNPGNLHDFGKISRDAIDNARSKISEAFNINQDGIIFTSCGSEANTLAIVGVADYLIKTGKTHVITTKYEHASVLNSMKKLEKMGIDVTYVDVESNGGVSCDKIINYIRPNTGLISVMSVNNELGSINKVSQIYKFCRRKNIILHSDCVQAVGSIPINMETFADMISVSGHKIHAPKGIGCLCVKEKNILTEIIAGGEQEFGLRGGTENVPAIAVFGEAVKRANDSIDTNLTHIEAVSLVFGAELLKQCEIDKIPVYFNCPYFFKSPKILSIRFDGIDSQTLVLLLSQNGVCVSAGSACSSHSTNPSHVLMAVGLTEEEARSTIRVSFSELNTVEEATYAAKVIAKCVKELKTVNETVVK